MAEQVIYKNIGIADEPTWGSSTGIQRYLQIQSTTLTRVVNKNLVMDTATTPKGHDRVVSLKNEIGGDIVAYASPEVLHNMFKWANGISLTGTSVGSSAQLMTYNQDVSGTLSSFSVSLDRNNAQEKFTGLRGTKLMLKATDNIVEATLSVLGKDRVSGISVVDLLGETFKPLTFADITISIAGLGYTNPITLNSSDWSIEYSNNAERTHLSGSKTASRIDAKIATLSGSIKIFHVGNSWVDLSNGLSEAYIRIEGIPDSSSGLIAGVTPYYMRIDIPRVTITTDERPYQQNTLAVETLKFDAMFDPGTSVMWKPQMTVGMDIET